MLMPAGMGVEYQLILDQWISSEAASSPRFGVTWDRPLLLSVSRDEVGARCCKVPIRFEVGFLKRRLAALWRLRLLHGKPWPHAGVSWDYHG